MYYCLRVRVCIIRRNDTYIVILLCRQYNILYIVYITHDPSPQRVRIYNIYRIIVRAFVFAHHIYIHKYIAANVVLRINCKL